MGEKIYKTVGKIFRDTPTMKVPLYQREYSWQGHHIDQLLEDIDGISVKHISKTKIEPLFTHFLGLLVFIETKTHQGEEVYSLVDGQQRIGTLMIIAAASIDIINQHLLQKPLTDQEREVLNEIIRCFRQYIYIKSIPFGEKTPKLIPNKNDKKLFNILVMNEDSFDKKKDEIINTLGKTSLRKRCFKAYDHIYTYLEERIEESGINFMIEFLVKIDSGLTFIPFVSESDTDAFNLFETLNDRGLNLSALDLIKNKVLQQAGDRYLEEFDSDWSSIFGKEGIMPYSKAQFFLRNFLMVRKGHIPNSKVYDRCKEDLSDFNSTRRFLDEVNVDANHFRDVIVVQDEKESGTILQYIPNEDVAELLFLLGRTRVKQWLSIGYCSYALYRNKEINKNDLLNILELLLNISIRFKILNKRFNYIEKLFPDLAYTLKNLKTLNGDNEKTIKRNESIASVKKTLKKVITEFTPDKEIDDCFNDGYNFDDNDLAFVLLRKIARKYISHGLNFSARQKHTLEHVLPEKYISTWGKVRDGDNLKYSIGNMLLVESSQNSRLKNKNFADKKAIYQEISVLDLVTDDNLSYKKADAESWTKHFIRKREQDLLEQIKKVISI